MRIRNLGHAWGLWLVLVAAPWSSAIAQTPEATGQYPHTIYRYRNKSGRPAFTNIWDQVPASERGRAEKVDLSKVTLNPQLGAELDAQMEAEFEVLSASPECREATTRAAAWWRPVWDEYGHLIILGGLLLALFLATPYALKRVDAPTWSRTLTKSITLIGFVGLFMHTSVRAGKTYESMKRGAAPCERATWTKAADGKKDGRVNKLQLLMDLQAIVEKAKNQTDEDRLRELDKLMEGVRPDQ